MNALEDDGESFDPNFCTSLGKIKLGTVNHDNLTFFHSCANVTRDAQSPVDTFQVSYVLTAIPAPAQQQQQPVPDAVLAYQTQYCMWGDLVVTMGTTDPAQKQKKVGSLRADNANRLQDFRVNRGATLSAKITKYHMQKWTIKKARVGLEKWKNTMCKTPMEWTKSTI